MAKNVLVIDDEADIGEMIKIRLEANGYRVVLAYDGLDGIEKAKKEVPDIILLDILMPQMDGFEVCQRLRVIPKMGNVPIIMLTAIKTEATLERAREAGSQDYLVKPFDGQELAQRVRFYLEKKNKIKVQ